MKIILAGLLGLLCLLGGCSGMQTKVSTSHNPTAKEVLSQNQAADIFQWDGVIYKNASQLDWVLKEHLKAGKKLGTIKKTYKGGGEFENGMATKLPTGTAVYEPEEKSGPILIVKVNGKEIPYLGQVEG